MLALGLICLCVVGQVLGACEDDLKNDKDFIQCKDGYKQFSVNMMSAIVSGGDAVQTNPNFMTGLICSPEAKAALGCVFNYVGQCPAIASEFSAESVWNQISKAQEMGGVEGMCTILESMAGGAGPGTGVTGPTGGQPGGQPEMNCPELEECMKNRVDVDDPPAGATPFSNIQFQADHLCGPMKDTMMCLEKAKQSCEQMAMMSINSVKQAMEAEKQKKAGSPSTVPTYDSALRFMKNECGSKPSDFTTSTCVKTNIDSKEFVDCFSNVTVSTDPKSCTSYHAGEKCVMSTVGEKCGQDYGLFIVKGAKEFVANIPASCEPLTETSGTTTIRVSIATLLMLILTAFKMI